MAAHSVIHMIRPRPAGEVGGADLHVADLAEAQRSRRSSVAVVSFGNPEYTAMLRQRGIDAIEVNGDHMRAWYRVTARAIVDRQPDVLHSHGYRADMIAAALRRWSWKGRDCRPALVMSIHGFIRTGVAFRTLTYLNERCLPAADLVITTSSAEADRLAHGRYPPARFIPNGVRPAPSASRDLLTAAVGMEAAQRVAFIGRLSPEKRPDLFVQMAALVRERYPDCLFVIIGTGPLESVTRRLAERLGVADRVRFAGLRRDVGQLLRGVDVLVCPSDSEGTPRVAVEAMLSGVPVVATRVGGLPDLITDSVTGMLVEPGSPHPLADAVRYLLDDPKAAQRIGMAGAAQALSPFSIDHMERQVAEVYAEARELARADP